MTQDTDITWTGEHLRVLHETDEIDLTMAEIGFITGLGQMTVSNRIRTARDNEQVQHREPGRLRGGADG